MGNYNNFIFDFKFANRVFTTETMNKQKPRRQNA